MKHTLKFSCLAVLVSLMALNANADVVDHLDFSNAGDGVVHNTSGDFNLPSSPVSGGTAPNDWVLSYDNMTILTDASLNEFHTIGGILRVQDFGGIGELAGSWLVIGDGSIDITGVGVTIGTDVFNSTVSVGPGSSVLEGVTWFYSINGGTRVENFLGDAELGGPVESGVDIGNDFTNVAVSAGDLVTYGFSVAVDGANDGVEIASVEIDFTSTAVPEPASAMLLAMGMIGLVVRRKRS